MNLSAGINWEHTRSSGLLPVKNNSGKYRFRISGWYRMPWNLTLSSNLVINRPFGYIEKSMNTLEWIWNAELTYSIRKGMWRIGIKANDILNQDKGLIYYESATGRTQTLNTVLPRYVMLTVHYRFNSKAKKRAK
ncbi:MAG: outer membrane beta-barrel family protein [Muribaculaceae bacterium]|nr:outer membrane beta-barrel family protein [Muribaculaceae bacterium]